MSEVLLVPVEIEGLELQGPADVDRLFEILAEVGRLVLEEYPDHAVLPCFEVGAD